jgi:hypothetical protein
MTLAGEQAPALIRAGASGFPPIFGFFMGYFACLVVRGRWDRSGTETGRSDGRSAETRA